ncbi:MAG: hypothetical protein WKF71_20480 [Pyrinomonadaceae bacterium]
MFLRPTARQTLDNKLDRKPRPFDRRLAEQEFLSDTILFCQFIILTLNRIL